jgi:hypothetical protein
MTTKSASKTRARELQALTGWAYVRCLALVEKHPGLDVDQIAKLEGGAR